MHGDRRVLHAKGGYGVGSRQKRYDHSTPERQENVADSVAAAISPLPAGVTETGRRRGCCREAGDGPNIAVEGLLVESICRRPCGGATARLRRNTGLQLRRWPVKECFASVGVRTPRRNAERDNPPIETAHLTIHNFIHPALRMVVKRGQIVAGKRRRFCVHVIGRLGCSISACIPAPPEASLAAQAESTFSSRQSLMR
jgi:hypothetical protein